MAPAVEPPVDPELTAWQTAWDKMLSDGVVFDWDRAAPLIRAYRATTAYAAVGGGDPRVAIVKEGKPALREPFKFAGTSVFELWIGDEVWNCFAPRSEKPEWDEHTWWPDSARALLTRGQEP